MTVLKTAAVAVLTGACIWALKTIADVGAIWLVPSGIAVGAWWLSLRRTHAPLLFVSLEIALLGFGLLVVAGMHETHHTLAGVVAADLAATLLVLAVPFGVECEYSTGKGAIYRARHTKQTPSHRTSLLPKPKHQPKWEAQCVSDSDGFKMYVARDGSERQLIGKGDPIHDPDEFMNLKIKADTAAETLNALKVE